MNIRKFSINDFNLKFINLLKQLTETPDISEEQFKKQFNLLNKNDLYLVIEENKKIIAYGSILIDFKFHRNCRNVGHIEDIVVDKNERGRGLSKILLEKLIDYGKNMNCYKLILNCKDEYIIFYKKFNFEKNGNNMTRYLN